MSIDKLKTKFFTGAWLTDVKHYFSKINEIIDYLNGNSGDGSYKVYTALLTQTGTNAPVAIVLKNTLGYTPMLNYDDVGRYSIVLQNALYLKIYTEYKYINTISNDGDYTIKVITEDDNLITISTRVSSTGVHTDLDIIYNFPIEIRIYN